MTIKLNDNIFFKLHSCCIPVQGAKRSIICDLQRQSFIFIPNELAELFLSSESTTIQEIGIRYADYVDFIPMFLEWIEMLQDEEYGFCSSSPDLFPSLNSDILSPIGISNVIIDIANQINFNLPKFINELSLHLCQIVVLRFYREVSKEELIKISEFFHGSTIRYVEIIIPYNEEVEFSENVLNFVSQTPIYCKVTIYNSPQRNEVHRRHNQELVYTEFPLTLHNSCGYISPHYFKINNKSFFESKKFNSCLYKKLAVDKDGHICNCPSLKERFGHYDQLNSLNDVIKTSDFTFLGKITKDQIIVCKDCEFRYICHDCRAHVEEKGNVFSKPNNCNYNPYEAVWG